MTCVQKSRCDLDFQESPLPLEEGEEVKITLLRNFLGEQHSSFGPVEVGGSITVTCKDSSKVFDMEVPHEGIFHQVEQLIAEV